MPLGPAPTPPPAAPVNAPGTGAPGSGGPGGPGGPGTPAVGGPGVHAASVTGVPGGAGELAPGPVPVSAARAERDAIAAAATAGAMRRKNAGGDALMRARRIAAALNAPDMISEMLTAAQFLWITAVTVDGTILVANNYGLAFVPDGVHLPEGVQLVTADVAIPAAERAQWATYPTAALLGWAAHHETRLRAVIATPEQLAGLDPGAPKIELEPDDIPSSGKMTGRSRLEVVSPGEAQRLVATSDLALLERVPPATVDSKQPEDQTGRLWFEAFTPLTRSNPGRPKEHLTAFVDCVRHAAEHAQYQAHTAVHAQAQRAAVADWMYWNYLSTVLADALTEAAVPS